MTTKTPELKLPKLYETLRPLFSQCKEPDKVLAKMKFGAWAARPDVDFALDNGGRHNKPIYVRVGHREMFPKAKVTTVCLRCGTGYATPRACLEAHDQRDMNERGENHPFCYLVTEDSEDGAKAGQLLSSLAEFYPEADAEKHAPGYTLPELRNLAREGFAPMPLAGR